MLDEIQTIGLSIHFVLWIIGSICIFFDISNFIPLFIAISINVFICVSLGVFHVIDCKRLKIYE